jgi:hypothetical protein
MESSQALTQAFNNLVQTYGFTSVLEAVNDLIMARIDAIDAFSEQFDQRQVEALKNVTEALTELSQTSLIDMDVEIALEHLMHTSSTAEHTPEHLNNGLE